VLGRGLAPADAKSGAPPVFVMSYKMWKRRFSLDPSVLGRSFVLNGIPTTLVGVMPPRFTKLGADLWRPTVMNRADPDAKRRFYNFQARLKPGVTPRDAQADIEVIAHRLAQVYPDTYPKKFTVSIIPWVDSVVGEFKTTLYTIAAAVG